MPDKELRRTVALQEIFNQTRWGIVDDVTFDLRHPELDPVDWSMAFLTNGSPRPGSLYWMQGLPKIWFPWDGVFDPKNIDDVISREKSLGYRPNVAMRKKQLMPDVVVERGDRVEIANVRRIVVGMSYYPLPDREMRLAFLRIVHTDGSTEELGTPIELWHHASMRSRDIIGTLTERMLRELGASGLQDPRVRKLANSDDPSLLSVALHKIQFLEKLRSDAKQVRGTPYESTIENSMLNAAAAFGYFWARSEAESNIEPLALGTLQRQWQTSQAGSLSGEARKTAAAQWQKIVLEIAIVERRRNPVISQNKLAEKIEGQRVPGVPAYDSIKRYLSRCEREGLLERPTKRR